MNAHFFAVDAFSAFSANDLRARGLQDAIGMWCSMTESTPLPVHPGDCKACRERPTMMMTSTFARPERLDEMLRKAAEAVTFMRSGGCKHLRKSADQQTCTVCGLQVDPSSSQARAARS